MQQPIRYYITKSGDEPTVRSVRIAREETRSDDRDDLATARADVSPVPAEVAGRRQGVKRLVQGAIRKSRRSS